MLNWQYTNYFINLPGSWFEGQIVPPQTNIIDSAHINGTHLITGDQVLQDQLRKQLLLKDDNTNF